MAKKDNTEFRLVKLINGKLITTEDLDRSQAEVFVATAQHMIDHLSREFKLNDDDSLSLALKETLWARAKKCASAVEALTELYSRGKRWYSAMPLNASYRMRPQVSPSSGTAGRMRTSITDLLRCRPFVYSVCFAFAMKSSEH